MAMLLLLFEALVLFSFSICPIIFCSQVIGDEFCSHFCCRLLIFCIIASVFVFSDKRVVSVKYVVGSFIGNK